MLEIIERRTSGKLVSDYIYSSGDIQPRLACYKFPIYGAGRIVRGEKTFEYRNYSLRYFPDVMVLYDCAPVSAFIALVEVLSIYRGDRNSVWSATGSGGGVPRELYMEHADVNLTYAYRLGKVRELSTPVKLRELGIPDVTAKGIQWLSVPTVNRIIQLSSMGLFG